MALYLRSHGGVPEPVVTYIIDRNVNYTNVCVAKCNFCAFYRDVGSADGYVLGFEEIFRKIDETMAVGGNQLLLQGARDAGVQRLDAIASEYFHDAPEHRALGARYLRENLKYYLRDEERAGLEAFYRYAIEVGAAPAAHDLRFY